METFTIIKDCQTEFTIEKSRFICNLKKVEDEKAAQEFIKAIKKTILGCHSQLQRLCYF